MPTWSRMSYRLLKSSCPVPIHLSKVTSYKDKLSASAHPIYESRKLAYGGTCPYSFYGGAGHQQDFISSVNSESVIIWTYLSPSSTRVLAVFSYSTFGLVSNTNRSLVETLKECQKLV